jgi:hypothetical protein
MRRATIVGFALCLSPVLYAAGCATQQDGAEPPVIQAKGGNSAGGGDSGGASGSSGASQKGGSPSGGSPGAGTGGSTNGGSSGNASGGDPGAAGMGGDAQGAGGDDGICENHAECDDDNECTDDACNLGTCQHTNNVADCMDDEDLCTDDICAGGICTHPDTGLCECEIDDDCDDSNPCTNDACTDEKSCDYTDNTDPCTDDGNVCTDDVCGSGSCQHNPNTDPCPDDGNVCTDEICGGGSCQHNPNTAPCPDDGSDCTDEICGSGSCQHTNNMTCECVVPGDCDAQEVDPGNCTFNRCSPAGTCDFVDNNYCPTQPTTYVINSFNSSTNWNNNVSTPNLLPLVDTGFNNTNLEGGANVYLADTDGASLTMDVAANALAGLDRIAIIIQSTSADTGSMVYVGVFDGTWHEVQISALGLQISQNQYGTIEIPLLTFDIPLGTISQVRLRTAPSGGEKIWRIDHIEARPKP